MSFNPLKPYNDLPLLPPKVEVETKVVLKKAISAGRTLAELKGLGDTIPNQSMLINTLVLQEARASSAIENIVTTNDALFKAFTAGSPQVDPATKEVLRYREALWEGFNALKKKPILTSNVFIKIVQIIKQNEQGIRKADGTVVGNPRTGEVYFTPPKGESIIREKLKNLEEFSHAEDNIDPLIKLALIHYQFEAIHPFYDGNGRTGRIVNILFLVMKGLIELPVIYLSKYIIEHKSEYYRLLRRITEKAEWEPWTLYILDTIEKTASFTRQRILDIRRLFEETLLHAKKKLPPRVYSKELIEILFRQPYTKGQFLVDAGISERQTASEYLKELEKAGILRSKKVGRENLYLNVKLYELLSK